MTYKSVKRESRSWIGLESQLRALINAFPGTASLVISDVAAGKSLHIDEIRRFPAARALTTLRRQPIWPNYWRNLSALIHYRP